MAARFRIAFLPLFFLSLATLFAAAVVVRVFHATRTTSSAAGPTPQVASSASRRVASRSNDPSGATVDAAGGDTATSTIVPVVETAAQRAREQKMREILATPAPRATPARPGAAPIAQQKPAAPPQPQAPPKQSAIARLLSPIVNAFSGGGSQASAATKPPPTPQQGSKPGGSQTTTDPKDPSSDSNPPQLVSIEFQPPQIQDGQESMVIITATDDISGVRNISGSLSSPSGKALQGFATQPQGDGQHFTSRVVIPKSAETGMWRVNFLTMSDNAANTANLHASDLPPTAVLRVISSDSDNTPPTLTAAWLDRRAINAGDKDTLFVQASDDKSGVALVSGVFVSPSKFARIGFGCHIDDQLNWDCDVPTPKDAECGDWQLESIQLQDKAGNQAIVRNDNPIVQAVKVNLAGSRCDNTPPQMTSIQLNPTAVSNVAPSVIQVTITATDDLSGVRDVSGQVMGPASSGTKTEPIYFQGAKTADPNTFVGHFTIPKTAAKGIWRVVWVSLSDNANNQKQYSSADPLLAGAQINVN